MTARQTYRRFNRRIIYFFPFQLLVLHLKKNHLLLLVWLLLFGYITEQVGVKYGLPYLFLFPEYFGQVSFLSFALTGFALGGFITAFNLYTYTLHGYRFPFVATIARPFLKFNVNNAVIPVLFTLTYLYCSARFQYTEELMPPGRITIHLLGFLTGGALFLMLALLYFTRTNTDIIKLLGSEPAEYRPESLMMDILGPGNPETTPSTQEEKRKANRWLRRAQRSEKWRVETYLTPRMQIKLARSSAHYDRDLLRSVLWQNHINGSIFEVLMVLSFILLGAFSDHRLFAIPAGASAFLLFTMVLMLISALFSWLQGWTFTLIVLAAVVLNVLSTRMDIMYDSHAFGVDYEPPPTPYTQPRVARLASDTAVIRRDIGTMLATLDQWAERNARADGRKPRLVIINTSGGGQRALLWTFLCMQRADSMLQGDLLTRTVLITGSSGGLMGATYFRQLGLADTQNGTRQRQDRTLLKELSSDMLNTVAFNFVTHDMFVRYRRVHDGDRSYRMDRGHAFDRRLDELTRGMLHTRLDDMVLAEKEARTPMLVIAPASMNDGRRLLIGSSPMAYLTQSDPEAGTRHRGDPDAIEYSRIFAAHDPGQITLTTALRMNATFPYITPVVSLPSEPPMQLMDAGMRDNFGYRITLSYLRTFRAWIAEHTSGVVILQLRDTPKGIDVRLIGRSLLSRLLGPLSNVYDNLVRVQDLDYDLMLQQASAWAGFPLELVELELYRPQEEHISLSWHLTALERERVFRSLETDANQKALQHLQQLVNEPATAIQATEGLNDTRPDRAADPVAH